LEHSSRYRANDRESSDSRFSRRLRAKNLLLRIPSGALSFAVVRDVRGMQCVSAAMLRGIS
jgi:hypothetical protein